MSVLLRAPLAAIAAAALLAPPAQAAPAAATGSFSYHRGFFDGEESFCNERSTAAATCAFASFTIDSTSKTSVGNGSDLCAGTFGATLRIESSTGGSLVIPGTITMVPNRGVFAGRSVVGTQVVTAELSYTGPKCGLATLIPVDTNISGNYAVGQA